MQMTSYQGFLPQESDGNAKLKSEYVKQRNEKTNEDPNVKTKQETLPAENNVDSTKDGAKPNKRVRGQNKNRPRPAKEDITNKLCPSQINESRVCVYGDKCRYMHDINAFMKVKSKDLGSECVSFRRRGFCPYSYACRFGGDHTTYDDQKGYQNIVNEELKSKNVPVANVLSREMQLNLRKRKVDFSRTGEALKKIEERKRIKTCETVDKTDQSSKAKELNCQDGKAEIKNGNPETSENLCKNESNFDQGEKTDTSDSTIVSEPSDRNLSSTETNNFIHGCVTDDDVITLRVEEKKKLDFTNKLYLAPLTTCGNLPFRVVCKRLGADITCGEMAVSTNLLQGQTSEWALIKRHESEDMFGVQLCGAFPDTMGRCAELLDKNCQIDFIDINMGCPIDLVYRKGAGSALMRRTNKLFDIVTTMNRVISVPLTCKLRTGIETNKNNAHNLMVKMRDSGVALATLHGRSREARYTRVADWQYIDQCARAASPMPVFGNGDVFSYQDYYSALENTAVSGIMIARGALIKPWIFTEIKERRDWDISSNERFDVLKGFANEGLMHWGSDGRGIEITRRFLLEWCSFLHRYIPLGILEQVPQRINERPPYYIGRNDLETLMSSPNSNDWVKLSEMLLGPVPDSFSFLPKHKANAYK